MMNEKQIDNISKLCYDVCKLMISIPVVGNILSEKFSIKVIAVGVLIAIIFLIAGILFDNMEVH